MNVVKVGVAFVLGFISQRLFRMHKEGNSSPSVWPPPPPAPTRFEGESQRSFEKRYLSYLAKEGKR